jgi:hypothetical protein
MAKRIFSKSLLSGMSVLKVYSIHLSARIGGIFSVLILLFSACGDPDQQLIQETSASAAHYLANQITPSGRFIYKINTNPETRVSSTDYNMLRHAGSIYALATYARVKPEENVLEATRLATQYLVEESIGPLPDTTGILAVWSTPELHGDEKKLVQAKLGGAGLGLVALTTAAEVLEQPVPDSLLRQLGHFVLYMQEPDGRFVSKYIPKKGGKRDKFVSLYYPGEAVLGLLKLYRADPQEKWLKAAEKGLDYLAGIRKEDSIVPPDHWALIATAELSAIKKEKGSTLSEAHRFHAHQIINYMLGELEVSPVWGCFSGDGRTTPTATRMEGLVASLKWLEQGELREKVVEATQKGTSFLIHAQVKEGKYAGGIPRATQAKQGIASDPEVANFNRKKTEVRIDYVQHALSAFLDYEEVFH